VEEERVQRRLAAILAADVAGYSRLIGLDEEGTIARLRALRRELIDPALTQYGGRVIKTMGDGLLIEFPSVVDAVRCAAEVQRAMAERNSSVDADKRIEFRVGIHVGDVVVDGDDLLGDGVNVAARLEALSEPGGVYLSEDAHRQVRDKVLLAFSDLGEQRLKNIARLVNVFRLHVHGQSAQPISLLAASNASVRRPSILVLPFLNLSGDPKHDFVVDAVTENLTTDLSRNPEWAVAARNTAFAYKGKSLPVTLLGREAGVQYVVEGSIQHVGPRMRVNIQLIDAMTGEHLWAERFDKSHQDMLAAQDEISMHASRGILFQVRAAEARRAELERSDRLTATDFVTQGWTAWYQDMSRESSRDAVRLFEKAVQQEPENVAAICGLSIMKSQRLSAGWSQRPDEDRSSVVVDLANRAVALNATFPFTLAAKGWCALVNKRPHEAVAAFEQLVETNPALGAAHANLGLARICTGSFREAIEDIHTSIRLSPRDPLIGAIYGYLGVGFLLARDLVEAVPWLQKSVNRSPKLELIRLWLASALESAGHHLEAQLEIQASLASMPDWTARKVKEISLGSLSEYDLVIDEMRKAGLPDQ
jgi:class 3 adenylate cyclase/TolB-like protein